MPTSVPPFMYPIRQTLTFTINAPSVVSYDFVLA